MSSGHIYALFAYSLWGLFPFYWKLIHNVPAFEILCHRIVWSFGFLVILLWLRKSWKWIQTTAANKQIFFVFLLSSLLLSVNWLIYIWAVNANYIVEASLGYFITPIVNVLLGVLFLKEKLRKVQWISIAFALCGVSYLTFNYGSLPWIALSLAITFAFYGLIKKRAQLQSLEGLSLETAILFIPSAAYLLYLEFSGSGSFGHTDVLQTVLLGLAGIITAIPLLFFNAATRRIPLSTLGFFQYISPSVQFLIGVFVFKEPFTAHRFIGFFLIWTALFIYSIEGIFLRTTKRK